MPKRFIIPTLICPILALFVPAAPAVELSTSDRVALLYSSQLQFSVLGDALIKVGLVEDVDHIRFTPNGPIVVLPLGQGGPQIEMPGQVEYEVSLVEGNPGTYRYWAIVARLFETNRGELALLRDGWRDRGYNAQTFELGSFFAIQGNTFDNRQTIVAVGGAQDRQEALDLAGNLEQEYGIPSELHVELVTLPSGSLELTCTELGVTVRHDDLLWINLGGEGEFSVPAGTFVSGSGSQEDGDHHYTGSLIFTLDSRGRLAMVNEVPAERLLQGILPAEIYPSAPMEALKAQAVAARSELLAELGVRHLADPYMICAQQHCQVYRGIGAENPRTSEAVRSTRGVILLWDDHIAHTVYSASCGGFSGDYANTWGHEPIDYLTGHFDGLVLPDDFQDGLNESNIRDFLTSSPDAYCNLEDFGGSNTFRWHVEYSDEELSEVVNRRYDVGPVSSLEILERDPSGRVVRLRVVGERSNVIVERELAIRRALGGLRSALFVMEIRTGSDGTLSRVVFDGGGFGHGVGLCQTGAIGAASTGMDYLAILGHYYPGTHAQTLW